MKLSELYKESRRLRYLGQCDILRGKCDANEGYWHQMMDKKQQMDMGKFLNSVDFKAVIDEDETPEQYVNDQLRQDPDTAAYISIWGDKLCMFLQTAGFEFIFIQG